MSTKTSDNDDFVQIQQPAEMSPTELTPAESKAGDTVPPPPPEMPLEPVEDESGESVIQGRVEDGANPPIKLIQLESLLTLLKEIPGFGLQGSVYQFRSPISGTALTDLLKQTDRISHISLSDLDKESLAPSVFVRLALLRNPAGYLFPSLSEIAINKGNTFLEFLSVFSSPALRQLKITGVDEANETPLAAFLGTGSAEAAELKSVLLDDNVLSQKTVEYVAKFSHLKTLHLIDTLPSFDFHLLEMLGRIQTLEDFSFCQSSSSIEYRSQATVHAEAESNRLAEEKEQRRLAEENERKRLEVVREREAVEKRQREQLEKEKEQRKMEEAPSSLPNLIATV
ncbi:hypothetical protein CPB83DRAFT_130099 [Crepidotus variabilis]|uniref:Uncharacterized protein n=1 Tax=Crepidotus variabilis TaxID=179855 RepID=A0A9P6ELX9_9AGAR|nr:hypothetical protein CPB83DRAFT_130099 [Crepidotus variabilis]